MGQLWKKLQDPQCVQQIGAEKTARTALETRFTKLEADYKLLEERFTEIESQLGALSGVVGEVSAQQGAHKEEVQVRLGVLDGDLNEMESRVTARIEPLEDKVFASGDGETDYSNTEEPEGYKQPSLRKKEAAAAASDSSVFLKPYVPKHKTTPAAEPATEK
jgi:hypothetical protein